MRLSATISTAHGTFRTMTIDGDNDDGSAKEVVDNYLRPLAYWLTFTPETITEMFGERDG